MPSEAEDDFAEMFMESDDDKAHDGVPVPDESNLEPEVGHMQYESDGDAEMSDEDQG